MPRDTTSKEWFQKAETDYFSAFIKLWLAFNALYRRDYRDRGFGKNDRMHIEALKTENNALKRKFKKLFDERSDDAREFRLHLIELIRKYDGGLFGGQKIVSNSNVKPQMNKQNLKEISFKDFIHNRSFQLKKNPDKNQWIKIGKIYIKNLPDDIWPYSIEILYMIRNMLIHGEIGPTEVNHEIIKNCYFVLNILIKDEV